LKSRVHLISVAAALPFLPVRQAGALLNCGSVSLLSGLIYLGLPYIINPTGAKNTFTDAVT